MERNFIPCHLTVRQIAKSLMPHMARMNKDYVNGFKDRTGIEIKGEDENWEEYALEEFLLFPTDLFAFTSSILSITGAYHLVVSPPRYTGETVEPDGTFTINWQPYDKEWLNKTFPGRSGKKTIKWTKEVRKLGLKWRLLLNERFKEADFLNCKMQENPADSMSRLDLIKDRVGLLIERIRDDYEKELEWIEPSAETNWIPSEIRFYWKEFRKLMSPVKFCHDADFGSIEDLLCDEQNFRLEDKIEELPEIWRSFCALITLHAIADEACVGWGLRKMEDDLIDGPYREIIDREPYSSIFQNLERNVIRRANNKKSNINEWRFYPQMYAEKLLQKHGTMSTINNLRGRILPKRHTPSVGITLRALSSNLAFHRSSIDVKWRTENEVDNGLIDKMEKSPTREKTFSILLLPWALDISPLDFTTVPPNPRLDMKPDYGFFAYSPRDNKLDMDFLIKTLNGTKKETQDVDLIVLPECALELDELGEFEKIIGTNFKVSAYVSGVRKSNNNDEKKHFHDNMVVFRIGDRKKVSGTGVIDFGEIKPEEIQHKHHRWRLNRTQIETYNLGHILSPNKDWWEAIKIRRRRVTFVNIGDELTICPLICEDLARQDPIADLIRTVGPSLVITILMDGPQKKERWSAKYASVLAEDPGCATLTLTSLGMVKRSLPPNLPPSRVVALWNDGIGFAREIELEKGAVGILLSLSVESRTEMMADGREEFKSTNCIKLGGIHHIYPKT